MIAERDSMTLNEVSYSALGVEERSDEAPRAGRARPTPDPEVVAKPKRRQFTAEYRLRILEEAERCTQRGEVGRLLRREGLYSSHLTAWRKARRKGSLRYQATSKLQVQTTLKLQAFAVYFMRSVWKGKAPARRREGVARPEPCGGLPLPNGRVHVPGSWSAFAPRYSPERRFSRSR